jgi:hypothetical protein
MRRRRLRHAPSRRASHVTPRDPSYPACSCQSGRQGGDPGPALGVAHASVSVLRCLADCRLRSAAPIARALSRVCTLYIASRTLRTLGTDTALTLAGIGHHMISVQQCSASSRLVASLRPAARASALTTPARSSKVAPM